MMALLNRPLTEDEARKMRADWREGWPKIPSFYDMLVEAVNNPTPHVVRYNATDDRVIHVPPTHFYAHGHKSPSDCEWIVPGTHTREFNNGMVRSDAELYGTGYSINGYRVSAGDVYIKDLT
jgi:hypothetical protein